MAFVVSRFSPKLGRAQSYYSLLIATGYTLLFYNTTKIVPGGFSANHLTS